jgi:hypothetical protein
MVAGGLKELQTVFHFSDSNGKRRNPLFWSDEIAALHFWETCWFSEMQQTHRFM